MRKVYIAGPYRADTPLGVDRNIMVAREAMAALLEMGYAPFCPHAMTAHFEHDFPAIPDEVYLRTDMEWLRLCDAVLMLPGWEKSSGAKAEAAEATRLDIPVYCDLSPFREGRVA